MSGALGEVKSTFLVENDNDISIDVKTQTETANYKSKNIKFTIVLTVVNLANLNLQGTMFNSQKGVIKLSNFSGSGAHRAGEVDYVYYIDAFLNFKVVSTLDQIGTKDHVMIIAKKLKKSPKGDALGYGNIGGHITAISSLSENYFDEVVLHEIGHNLGLDHEPNTLMNPNVSGNKTLNEEQKGYVISRLGIGGLDAKDGKYIQSKTKNSRYEISSKKLAEQFIKDTIISVK